MRLQHPNAGTVVHVGDDLAEQYLAAGWIDTEKPKRTRKTD